MTDDTTFRIKVVDLLTVVEAQLVRLADTLDDIKELLEVATAQHDQPLEDDL